MGASKLQPPNILINRVGYEPQSIKILYMLLRFQCIAQNKKELFLETKKLCVVSSIVSETSDTSVWDTYVPTNVSLFLHLEVVYFQNWGNNIACALLNWATNCIHFHRKLPYCISFITGAPLRLTHILKENWSNKYDK